MVKCLVLSSSYLLVSVLLGLAGRLTLCAFQVEEK